MSKFGISIIGSGNVAVRFSLALAESGYAIDYIYNRSKKNGERLAAILRESGQKTEFSSTLEPLTASKIIIIAVTDEAILEVIQNLSLSIGTEKPIVFHTSGATSLSELAPLGEKGCKYGVLYPLMTLSKSKNIVFNEVPFLLEASDDDVKELLIEMLGSLNSDYTFCDSEKRLRMHTAAVFSCNFVNYFLSVAFDIAGHSPTLLLPATIETVRKAFLVHPTVMQTGPAIREDVSTINKHLELLHKLGFSEYEELYKELSQKIAEKYNKKIDI